MGVPILAQDIVAVVRLPLLVGVYKGLNYNRESTFAPGLVNEHLTDLYYYINRFSL